MTAFAKRARNAVRSRVSLRRSLARTRRSLARTIAAALCIACSFAAPNASAQKAAPHGDPKPAPTSAPQSEPLSSEPKHPAPPPSKVDPTLPTRYDLARAYVRFERALRTKPPPDEQRKAIDSAFDKLTVAFFAGDARRAIETMNDLTAGLDPEHAPPAERLAMSLRAQLEPSLLLAGAAPRASLEVVQMYSPVEARELAGPWRFVLLDSSGAECASAGIDALSESVRRARCELVFSREKLDVGMYRIALDVKDSAPCVIARCFAVERPLDSVRHANEARLAKVESSHPKLLRALDTCRARNQLLTERPSKSVSAQFLVDPIVLQRELASEIASLESGEDPYYRRKGDLWRVFRSGSVLIPLRTFAPDSAASGARLPLVIALHGASGDENMFFEGYGGGRLVELAREKGFLLAAPELGFSFADGKRFDALMQSLSRDYNIDEERIYLLGHSMGAAVAGALSSLRKEKLAAVACFAGSPSEEKTDIAPTLVIIGGIDPLSDAAATRERIEREHASGVPIEFRLASDQGHTLPVGRYLGDAVDWLLAHARGARDAPAVPR
jgi:predicted esterase